MFDWINLCNYSYCFLLLIMQMERTLVMAILAVVALVRAEIKVKDNNRLVLRSSIK